MNSMRLSYDTHLIPVRAPRRRSTRLSTCGLNPFITVGKISPHRLDLLSPDHGHLRPGGGNRIHSGRTTGTLRNRLSTVGGAMAGLSLFGVDGRHGAFMRPAANHEMPPAVTP